MNQEKLKEYSNDDITIIWESSRCIHAARCVGSLPQVYKPNEKPWIKIENATSDELIAQIKTCPSRALTYRMNK